MAGFQVSTEAQAGDSGALVVTRVECQSGFGHREGHVKYQLLPVGMVVAAGDPATVVLDQKDLPPQYTIVSPMKHILNGFDAELLIS
jgi:hypothetical protein